MNVNGSTTTVIYSLHISCTVTAAAAGASPSSQFFNFHTVWDVGVDGEPTVNIRVKHEVQCVRVWRPFKPTNVTCAMDSVTVWYVSLQVTVHVHVAVNVSLGGGWSCRGDGSLEGIVNRFASVEKCFKGSYHKSHGGQIREEVRAFIMRPVKLHQCVDYRHLSAGAHYHNLYQATDKSPLNKNSLSLTQALQMYNANNNNVHTEQWSGGLGVACLHRVRSLYTAVCLRTDGLTSLTWLNLDECWWNFLDTSMVDFYQVACKETVHVWVCVIEWGEGGKSSHGNYTYPVLPFSPLSRACAHTHTHTNLVSHDTSHFMSDLRASSLSLGPHLQERRDLFMFCLHTLCLPHPPSSKSTRTDSPRQVLNWGNLYR